MNKPDPSKRRVLTGALAAAGSWMLAGCDRLGQTSWFPKLLATSETVSRNAHQLLGGRRSISASLSRARRRAAHRSIYQSRSAFHAIVPRDLRTCGHGA